MRILPDPLSLPSPTHQKKGKKEDATLVNAIDSRPRREISRCAAQDEGQEIDLSNPLPAHQLLHICTVIIGRADIKFKL